MPKNPLHEFYRGVLDDPEAPPHLQHRVHQFARQRGLTSLLTDLASHPALIDELDEQFAADDSAPMVRAWMARPGRDPERIAQRLTGETRVTVLEVIAALEELDATAFDTLAAVGHHRVATALLDNPSTPDGPRAAAVATMAGRWSERIHDPSTNTSGHHLNRKAEPLRLGAVSSPEATAAAVEAAWHPSVMQLVAPSLFMTAELAQQAAATAIGYETAPHPDDAYSGRINKMVAAVCDVLGDLVAGPGRSDALLSQVRGFATKLQRDHAVRARIDRGAKATMDRAAALLASCDAGPTTSGADLARIQRATAVDTLTDDQRTALISDAVRNGPPEAVRLLARAPSVTGDDLLRIMRSDHVDWTATSTIVAARRRDPVNFGVLLSVATGHIARGLSSCSNPTLALESLIDTCTAKGLDIPKAALESPLLTVELLTRAPARVLAQSLPAQTRRLATELVDRHFADDDEAWATFNGMFATFDEPLADLLAVCSVLTATADPELDDEAPDADTTAVVDAEPHDQLALAL